MEFDLTGGAVGLVTAMGMGTVFLCLILLYGITRLLGVVMLAATRRAQASAAASAAESSDTGAEDTPQPTDAPSPTADAKRQIAAAITLALSRHRAARTRAAAPDSGGADAWKMAGRIGMLRGG